MVPAPPATRTRPSGRPATMARPRRPTRPPRLHDVEIGLADLDPTSRLGVKSERPRDFALMLPVSRVTDENGTAVVQRNEGADVLSYRVVFGNRVGTRDAQLLERRPVDVRQRPDETEPPCRRVIDLGAVGRTIIHSHPVIRAEASDDQNPTVGKGDRGRSEAREGEVAGGRPAAGGGG